MEEALETTKEERKRLFADKLEQEVKLLKEIWKKEGLFEHKKDEDK